MVSERNLYQRDSARYNLFLLFSGYSLGFELYIEVVRIQVLESGIREGIDRSELVVDIKAC